MFRWTVSSCRVIAGVFALLGACMPALADPPTLPSTSLGQPQPVPSSTPAKAAVPSPSTAPAKSPAGPRAAAVPAPQQPTVPPAPAPALPGLGALMTPNGIALPGGVGFIRPGAESVGVQINTPDGVIEFTVPRRHRRDRGVQQPEAAQGTTDAPLFGQSGRPASSAAPQASVPGMGIDNEPIVPGESKQPGAGRPNREAREFAHDSRLFHARNYPLVLRRLDRALAREPGDRDLLQLRSLTHLMLGDFKSAYADALVVLEQDDVWDWSTLRSLYHSGDEYTTAYRGLEDRVIANPNAVDLRILLGYQDLMLGHRDAAKRHFERVLAIDSSNDVARRMIAAEQPPQPRDSAQMPPMPSRPGKALAPIPARKRPAPSAGSSQGGGVSIDLGQPSPAPPAQEPGPSKPATTKPGG